MTSIKEIIYFLGLKAKEKTAPSMDGKIQAYYEGRQKAYNHCKEILEGYMKQFTTNEQKMTREEIIDSILLCVEIEGDGGCSSFKNEEKEQMCSFINSLKQQPTLPSNVDEAANAYVGHPIEIDEDSSCYTTREAFKAGAEWMAKQGVSWEDELAYYDGLLLCGKDERAYTMESHFKDGDKVIVQIRKK